MPVPDISALRTACENFFRARNAFIDYFPEDRQAQVITEIGHCYDIFLTDAAVNDDTLKTLPIDDRVDIRIRESRRIDNINSGALGGLVREAIRFESLKTGLTSQIRLLLQKQKIIYQGLDESAQQALYQVGSDSRKIGRASCRERV